MSTSKTPQQAGHSSADQPRGEQKKGAFDDTCNYPRSVTLAEGVKKKLGVRGGGDLLYRVDRNSGPDNGVTPSGMSVTVSNDGAKTRYLLSAHSMRKHVVTSHVSSTAAGVKISSAKYGPNPRDYEMKAVAADLGLYPDYERGVDIKNVRGTHMEKTVLSLYAAYNTYIKHVRHVDQTSVSPTRQTTLLAYRDSADRFRVAGVTFDLDWIEEDTKDRFVIEAIVPEIRPEEPADDRYVYVHVPISMTRDRRGATQALHLYFGDGSAEAKAVYKLQPAPGEEDTSPAVQIIEFSSMAAVHEMLVVGNDSVPPYMRPQSYMCIGDMERITRELGPHLGHTVALTSAMASMDGAAFMFNHSVEVDVGATRRRVSGALQARMEDDNMHEKLFGFLSHFVHHLQTHHTTVCVIVDDSFWEAALSSFSVTDKDVAITEHLALLFLLRRVGGRSIRIVDVSKYGHGNLPRMVMHLAVHADCWPWLWLAASFRDTAGGMFVDVSSRFLNMDHESHGSLGTAPLQTLMRSYVERIGMSAGDSFHEMQESSARFYRSARVSIMHRVVNEGAISLGYVKFSRSPMWAMERPISDTVSSPSGILQTHLYNFQGDHLVAATAGILNHMVGRKNMSPGNIYDCCVVANALLTQFFMREEFGDDADADADTKKKSRRRRAHHGGTDEDGKYRPILCTRNVSVAKDRWLVMAAVDKYVKSGVDEACHAPWLERFVAFLEDEPDGADVCVDLPGAPRYSSTKRGPGKPAKHKSRKKAHHHHNKKNKKGGKEKGGKGHHHKKGKKGHHHKTSDDSDTDDDDRDNRMTRSTNNSGSDSGSDSDGCKRKGSGSDSSSDDEKAPKADTTGTPHNKDKKVKSVKFVVPESTEDINYLINSTAEFFVPNTGVFSFIVHNVLFHEALLTRCCASHEYSNHFGRTITRRMKRRLCAAMLDKRNMAAYSPRDAPVLSGTISKLFEPSHNASYEQWSIDTVPWWALAERAIGYRMSLSHASAFLVHMQDLGDATDALQQARHVAVDALNGGHSSVEHLHRGDADEDSTAEEKARNEVAEAVSRAQAYSWGASQHKNIMITGLTTTFADTAQSM